MRVFFELDKAVIDCVINSPKSWLLPLNSELDKSIDGRRRVLEHLFIKNTKAVNPTQGLGSLPVNISVSPKSISKKIETLPRGGLNVQIIKKVHGIVCGKDTRHCQFEGRSVSVDKARPERGFIRARIDVNKHIENLSLMSAKCDPRQRVAITCYCLSQVHPFADGNGRTLRALVPLVGSGKNDSGFSFWTWFSICSINHRSNFIEALSLLGKGSLLLMEEFYRDCVTSFPEFVGELS